ncbi:MAG: DegV family protein [Clostridia bacterium]|nr:DegV family protein [Clostridia bacterium]
MAKPVKITADSPCDIGKMLQARYDVGLIPLHVSMNNVEYLDGVNITNDMIYDNWHKTGSLPKTSAVSVGEYEDAFEEYLNAGYEVIHFSLGSGLSVTHQSAVTAAEELSGVYVIDSRSLSTGISLLICEAGERVKEGKDAKTIVDEINALTMNNCATFILDTLDFLHAGGRCSSLAHMGANLMSIKPSIKVVNAENGSMVVGKKYFGKLKKCILQYIHDQLADRTDIVRDRIFITHSGFPEEDIAWMKQEVEKYGPWGEVIVTTAGCTISSHCGPGCIGVLFLTK